MCECEYCKSVKERRRQKEKEYEERLKGYRFWCDTCCHFVDRNHMCEQWTHITYVSPKLYDAIRQEGKS